MPKIILNAGHGGSDPGIIYNDRKEKNDNLNLAFAVGNILEANGYDVFYTRSDDSFISPVDRAIAANEQGGDLLVNIHRGSSPFENTISGARALISENDGINVEAAQNVLKNLEPIGFRNFGVSSRDIYIQQNVNMPSFEIVIGYMNSDADNERFDTRFNDIANAVAYGIMETFENV
ncbi:MAG: N-acetylmuramoyl-L-alanine amidase [Mobilitalea sp.]